MIDTNRNIGSSRFQLVREFTANITASLKIHSPKSLVGVITVERYVSLRFNILRHKSLTTLLPAIYQLYYNGYYSRWFRPPPTNTDRALRFLLSEARQGGRLRLRNPTRNVAIVITYGRHYDSSSLRSAASALHAANIYDVYAVGISSNGKSQLRSIASDPSFVFSTSYLNSNTAQKLERDVVKKLCSSK